MGAISESPSSSSNRVSGPLLSLDDDQFAAYFDRYPFKIEHNLVSHPLLQLPRLVELASHLRDPILYFKADQAINQVDTQTGDTSIKRTFVDRKLTRPELSAVETIAQIENCRAWMQLRDVGSDPAYAALLREIIDEFRIPSEGVAPGLSAPRADIFVSSPGATTPFHLDEEHNFLLQIRGTKRLSIADGFNPAVLDRESLRAYFRGNGELTPYSAQLEKHSVHVDLQPGEGVHIPPCFPHWVQNGSIVSISLGILWFSDVTARRRHLYRVNGWLERAGLKPTVPGDHPRSDAFKAAPLTLKRGLRRWLQPVLQRKSVS
jgi:hypothetical protein